MNANVTQLDRCMQLQYFHVIIPLSFVIIHLSRDLLANWQCGRKRVLELVIFISV